MAKEEVWKPIPRHKGYFASNFGRIKSPDRILSDGRKWKGQILTNTIEPAGYEHVVIERKMRRVHCLVAEAFLGPMPGGNEVRHIDGNKRNNIPENLKYGTRSDNEADKVLHGTSNRGNQRSAVVKLTEEEVRFIKQSELRHFELARMFGVRNGTILCIRNGRNWKWVDVAQVSERTRKSRSVDQRSS